MTYVVWFFFGQKSFESESESLIIRAMKYSVNDRVEIKTWREMEDEYGLNAYLEISCNRIFTEDMEDGINRYCPDRVLTIIETKDSYGNKCYRMKELPDWMWDDCMIKRMIIPITSRFEILDI